MNGLAGFVFDASHAHVVAAFLGFTFGLWNAGTISRVMTP